MKKNIGIVDRIIRFVFFDLCLGANLSALDISVTWQVIFAMMAMNLLFTVITGYSVIYAITGFSTRQEEKSAPVPDQA